ncbi:restriction endonuclease subunit S [Clostridium perfringens]|uniref:restriction endonuclease subunit S n=1 Tax=Clostridium perfringens TaxID=1502 RepID=UPI0028E0E231|nr:restriction endonuclease subunit S [Clostridium perfringens]MDT9350228.1 restriction endonuclease subunit S [Clostridium perfringens]
MSRNVPKLRFKGFEDEWIKYKADDLFINISDKKHNGELNVLSVTQDKGVLLREELEIDIKFDIESVKNYKRVKAGDFIISLRSFQGGFEISNQEGLISPAYTVFNFKDSEKFNSKYFSYIFKSSRFIKKLAGLIYGVRDGKAISFTDFKTMTFFCPSLQEQEKIANFLSKVDSIIEKQEKKVQYWNSYKKGMMQKIFSQKIRFKDENGRDYPEWEEKKLGEITNILKGQQLNKENFISGGKYYVLNGGVNPSGYTNEYNVEGESISISEGGNSCGFVNYNKEKFWSGGHCYTLKLKGDEIHNVYLFEVLKYKEIYIMSLRIGTGLPNIQKLTLSKFKIDIPCLEEQIKIANFLSNIDNIIEKESKKLEELKQWKKGLLQQMFV